MAALQAAMLVAGVALLAAAAALLVSLTRPRSPIAFVLGAYVAAWSVLIVASLALSPLHEVRAWATWAWLAVVFCLAVAVWWSAGRPRLPLRRARGQVGAALRSPLVRIPSLIALVGVAYLAALAFATPENEWDALSYHVTRAAFWHQGHAISYVGNAVETRINVNPPYAEIGQLFTMLLTGSQRFVGLVQLAALGATVTGTVGIARRLGASVEAAVWSGILVLMFPVVTTQAPTALNDLVVASFLAAAAYFVLGEDRREHVAAGLSFGLAVGTKFTGVLALPLLLLMVAVGRKSGRLPTAAWLVGIGFAGGSVWYLVNLVNTGHADGGLAQSANQRPSSVHVVLGTAIRFGFNSLDLSGAPRGAFALYPLVGVSMMVVALRRLRAHGRERSGWLAGAGAFVVLTPSFIALAYLALFALSSGHIHQPLRTTVNTAAGATPSWFGPLGSVCVLAGAVVAWRAVRLRRVPPLGAVLALAPVIMAACIAVTLVWDPWRGRFLIFAYVLAASAWWLLLRYRWLAVGTTTLACVTFVAVLISVVAKPVGLPGFEYYRTASVWGKPVWWVESVLRPGSPDRAVLRAVDRRVPAAARIAVASRIDDFVSPYFGRDLERHVTLVLDGGRPDPLAAWLVAAPGLEPLVCPGEWRVVFARGGWRLARRSGSPICASPVAFAPSSAAS